MTKSNTGSTQKLPPVSPKLLQISEKAKQEPTLAFTSLAHLISPEMLRWSYEHLNRDAAPGVDGVTWQDYREGADDRLALLHRRMLDGQYRALPVRRVHIEKENGKLRPLGVCALEDKIVQKATVTILEAIYEQDFYSFSYGFRPGRSAHDALDALDKMLYKGSVNWIIDADISSYFDTVVHKELMGFLRKRVVDRNILRLISKWLHAGAIDDGRLLVSEAGTPQGSVISPLLANVYLHYVLDDWWQKEVVPRLRGRAQIVRYADDFVLAFENRDDAERVMAVLPKRFHRYGLELNQEKTRLIPFNRRNAAREKSAGRKPPTFTFLGFTHMYGKSRKGHLTYQLRTAKSRLHRGLQTIAQWCCKHRHDAVREQWEMLKLKLNGHYNYYGRSTNFRCLRQFYRGARRLWHKWLGRRHGRKPLPWGKFQLLLDRFPLPLPHITHRLFSA